MGAYQHFILTVKGKTQGGIKSFTITNAATGGRLDSINYNPSKSNTGNIVFVPPGPRGPVPSETWIFREVDATSP